MLSPFSGLALRSSTPSPFPRRVLTCRSSLRRWLSPQVATQQTCHLSSKAPNEDKARRQDPSAVATSVPQNIAVLGGGLTGLTTAYYLTRFHPRAKITLYEADSRLGGWVDTQSLRVTSAGEGVGDTKDSCILVERGARTVAPQITTPKWDDFVLYELIHELDCVDDVYSIPKGHRGLANRYIYYPDHLVSMPNPSAFSLTGIFGIVYKLLSEPVFRGCWSAAYKLYRDVPPKPSASADKGSVDSRPVASSKRIFSIADQKDVSLGDFLQGVLGAPDLVNNLGSAVVHGIWGGDIWKLSALESNFQETYVGYQFRHSDRKCRIVKHSDYFSGSDILAKTPEVATLAQRYVTAGYLGFKNGFHELAANLTKKLEFNPNVTIKQATPITDIQYDRTARQAVVTTSTSRSYKHDKIISSLYSGTLAKLTGDALPALKNSAAVTIQIVNLFYKNVNLGKRYPGFGYLIPQSVPAENNPYCALGVIFDSDRDAAAGIGPNRGTNLTVMLGGHYWDYLDQSSWPSEDDAIAMAKATVQNHLGISADEPVLASTKICRDCIPQHLVGHRDRMAQAHKELSDSFGGTLAVVGGSYTMPGVLPSLKAARDVALAISGKGYEMNPANKSYYHMKHVGKTGLGRFVNNNETFQLMGKSEIPWRFGSGIGRFNDPAFQE